MAIGRGRRRLPWRGAARCSVAAALIGLLVWRVGGTAFTRGLDAVTGPTIGAAFALTALSTLCAAWRWRVVARQLGLPVAVGGSIAAYYRSQLLNSVLPGGVLGDAHRAVVHGRDADDFARAARAVAWERTTGQIVQAAITVAVLLAMPSPGRRLIPVVTVAVLAVLVVAGYVGRTRAAGPSEPSVPSVPSRVVGIIRSDLRAVARRRVWPVLVVASTGVVVSHVALFVLVARVVDPAASLGVLLPLTMLVQVASSIPITVAGWGLREGSAAWAFAAAGLGAGSGVAASAAYGLVSLIALAPGVAVVATDIVRTQTNRRSAARPRVVMPQEAMSHG